jgi:hypothetical protein
MSPRVSCSAFAATLWASRLGLCTPRHRAAGLMREAPQALVKLGAPAETRSRLSGIQIRRITINASGANLVLVG